MKEKKIKISKVMSEEDLDLLFEAVDLYLAGGRRAAVGFFDNETDRPISHADHNPSSLYEMLENGEAYIRPIRSKSPEHNFSREEQLRLKKLRGFIHSKMEEMDKKTEKLITEIVESSISGVVEGFYELLKDDGGGKPEI